jgi:hypothetical protein
LVAGRNLALLEELVAEDIDDWHTEFRRPGDVRWKLRRSTSPPTS